MPDHHRTTESNRESDDPAENTHDDALDDKPSEHIGTARADRHADADLARPLGD
jgi:hypothetical protein